MNSIFDLVNLIASNVWLYGGTFVLVLSILGFVFRIFSGGKQPIPTKKSQD